MTLKRKFGVGVLCILCAVSFGGGVQAAREAFRYDLMLREAESERLVSLALDLSVTNSVTRKFHRKNHLEHGLQLWLELPGRFTNSEDACAKLGEFKGEVEVKMGEEQSKLILLKGAALSFPETPALPNWAWLHEHYTELTGQGEVRFEVTDPAPAMAGVPARLVVMNGYCGFEETWVTVLWKLAAICAFVALVTGLVARWLVRAANKTESNV